MSQLIINDYLNQLDLIKWIGGSTRVTTVSVETQHIMQAMQKAAR
jgi:hypothetical protein